MIQQAAFDMQEWLTTCSNRDKNEDEIPSPARQFRLLLASSGHHAGLIVGEKTIWVKRQHSREGIAQMISKIENATVPCPTQELYY